MQKQQKTKTTIKNKKCETNKNNIKQTKTCKNKQKCNENKETFKNQNVKTSKM